MNRILNAFTCGIACILIVSCTGETVDYSETPVIPEPPTDIPEVSPPAVASAPLGTIPSEAIGCFNDFSFKFYLANSAKGRENVCVSPFSVGAVLGMIANGDDGEARNEILKMLGFEENQDGLNALNTYYQTFLSNLPNLEEDITCNVTNTMWCDTTRYRIRTSFMQTIADRYYAYMTGINPEGKSGKEAINAFVSKNTKGLINNFLTTPLTVNLAFLNTLYFKAGWNWGFDGTLSTKRSFLTIDGKERKIDFMGRCFSTEYAITEDGTEAVRLDYGKNKRFSMTLILPSSKINHIPLDEALTADNITSIDKNMKNEYLVVRLPKFEVETNNPETIGILRRLGLEKAFDSSFRLIAESDGFYLNCFIHATKLKVDENGTEGAASSLGGMYGSSGSGGDINGIREIIFDRPFIFYIQENTTGAIIFIGSVKTLP